METNFRAAPTAKSPDITYLDLEDFNAPRLTPEKIIDYLNGFRPNINAQHAHEPPMSGASSKYKGVCKKKYISHGKAYYYYEAVITYNQKEYRLFRANITRKNAEKSAALAYDKAALELFGEQALTNQEYFADDFKEYKK